MKTPLLTATALAVLIALPIAARAAEDDFAKTHPFATADKDGDKKISPDEYVAYVAPKTDAAAAKEKFAALDKDHDGYLSREEFRAGMGTKGKKKKGD